MSFIIQSNLLLLPVGDYSYREKCNKVRGAPLAFSYARLCEVRQARAFSYSESRRKLEAFSGNWWTVAITSSGPFEFI